MAEISKELLAKLMKAASPEEAAELLKVEGVTDAPLDTVWQQLEELRAKAAQELSLDELSDVAGGVTNRNWYESGCAATVEEGSNCWGTDGGCSRINIKYAYMPNANCPRCGRRCWKGQHYSGVYKWRYLCQRCGELGEEVLYKP